MDPALFDLNAEVEAAHWWFAGRRRIMRSVLERGLPPDAAVVVDIGCGTGANIASLADRYRCVGIDPSEVAVGHARERFSGVEFVHGTAPGGLDEWADLADALLVMDVLEHVEDDRGLLVDLIESLHVGGHVLITVPANMSLWSEHDVSHGHFRRYDASSLRSVWNGLPVTEVLLSHFNSRLYPVVRAVRWLSKRRGRASGEEGSELKMPLAPANVLLRRLFGGESKRIVRALDGGSNGYRRGVSLIALLRREGV